LCLRRRRNNDDKDERLTDRQIRSGLLLIICALHWIPAGAGEVTEAQGRGLLDNFVEGVQSMSARFEQSLVDENNIVVDESRGTLEILRPGRFRWTYTNPYEQVLVADGLNIWSYDVDLAQVTVKPQRKVLASTPAVLLGGGGKVLDDFDYIGSEEDRGTIWVSLKPKDSESGFSKIELGFTDGELSRMMFADNLEQTTLIALFDVRVNPEIEDEVFMFEPPAAADLVGTPVTAGGAVQ